MAEGHPNYVNSDVLPPLIYNSYVSCSESESVSQCGGDIPQLDGNITIQSMKSDSSFAGSSDMQKVCRIPVIVDQFKRTKVNTPRPHYRVSIKRSNRILEATNLPIMMVLNPRSIYNKSEEFRTMMVQMEVDICCI